MLTLTPTCRQNKDRHTEMGTKHDSSSYMNMIQSSIILAAAWAQLLVMLDKRSEPDVHESLFLNDWDLLNHFLILSGRKGPTAVAKIPKYLYSGSWNLVFCPSWASQHSLTTATATKRTVSIALLFYRSEEKWENSIKQIPSLTLCHNLVFQKTERCLLMVVSLSAIQLLRVTTDILGLGMGL